MNVAPAMLASMLAALKNGIPDFLLSSQQSLIQILLVYSSSYQNFIVCFSLLACLSQPGL